MARPALSLESRIAAMLSAADAKSDAVVALITEVEVAAQEADATATKTREEALDPATVIDVAKVGASLATSELTRDRLRAALPRLQEQLKQAREREYAECWLNDYAAVKARRDAAAEKLRERYPAIVDELVTLMTNIAITDKEVSRVNLAAPYGDHPRLRGVELTARGLDRLCSRMFRSCKNCGLPTFHRDDGAGPGVAAARAVLGRNLCFPTDVLRAGGCGTGTVGSQSPTARRERSPRCRVASRNESARPPKQKRPIRWP